MAQGAIRLRLPATGKLVGSWFGSIVSRSTTPAGKPDLPLLAPPGGIFLLARDADIHTMN